jgi:hypothetical protein
MLVIFRHVQYTAIIHKTRLLPVAVLYRERARMTFLTLRAHNRTLDVTYHKNLGTTYPKELERGA